MRKRILSGLLVCLVLLNAFSYDVHADDAFKTALKDFLACNGQTGEPSEAVQFTWSTVISILKSDGRNVNVAASVCGCMLFESTGQIFAVEGHSRKKTLDGKVPAEFELGHTYEWATDLYPGMSPAITKQGKAGGSAGNGHGIIQWSFGRANNLSDFCTNGSLPEGCSYLTVTHNAWVDEIPRWPLSVGKANVTVANSSWQRRSYNIPDLPGQVAFMCKEFRDSYADKIAEVSNASSVSEACRLFLVKYMGGYSETSQLTNRQKAANAAVKMIEACGGVVGSAPVVTDPVTGAQTSPYGTQAGYQGLGAQMVNQGYWSEAQLASYCSLTETNLEETMLKIVDRSKLNQKDLEGLTDWERNHQADLEEHGYIEVLRWLVALVGILMTIWALFVYLAFWFDHINSFFYLDALHILTFGQLHICQPGDKPTFSLGKKVKTRTVSHKQIICICLTAILFGSMLISGVFYQIVNKFVNLILRWFR